MNSRTFLFAVACLVAGGATAQTATQARLLGSSDDPLFPIRIEGSDGQVYRCEAQIETRPDGQSVRRCMADGQKAAASVFGAGSGIAGGGAVAGAVLVVVGLALAADEEETQTTTTTSY